jgi:hypothetical protein
MFGKLKHNAKTVILLVSLLAAIGAVFAAVKEARGRKQVKADYAVLLEDVKVQRAQTKAARDSLAVLKAAAEALGGKLIGGVTIVTKPDTIYIPVTVAPTAVFEDSSRYAVRTDTLKGGYVVDLQAFAPPYPAPLELGANLYIPEFRPNIGFIRSNDGKTYHVAVDWAGMDYTLTNAFHVPEPMPRYPQRMVRVGTNIISIKGDLNRSAFIQYRWDFSKRLSVEWEVAPLGNRYVSFRSSSRLW